MNRNNMKNTAILLLGIISLITASCSSSPTDNTNPVDITDIDPVGVDPVDIDPIDPVDIDPVGVDPVDIDPIDPVDVDPVDIDPVDVDPVDCNYDFVLVNQLTSDYESHVRNVFTLTKEAETNTENRYGISCDDYSYNYNYLNDYYTDCDIDSNDQTSERAYASFNKYKEAMSNIVSALLEEKFTMKELTTANVEAYIIDGEIFRGDYNDHYQLNQYLDCIQSINLDCKELKEEVYDSKNFEMKFSLTYDFGGGSLLSEEQYNSLPASNC